MSLWKYFAVLFVVSFPAFAAKQPFVADVWANCAEAVELAGSPLQSTRIDRNRFARFRSENPHPGFVGAGVLGGGPTANSWVELGPMRPLPLFPIEIPEPELWLPKGVSAPNDGMQLTDHGWMVSVPISTLPNVGISALSYPLSVPAVLTESLPDADDEKLIKVAAAQLVAQLRAYAIETYAFRQTGLSFQPNRGFELITSVAELLDWAERNRHFVTHYRSSVNRIFGTAGVGGVGIARVETLRLEEHNRPAHLILTTKSGILIRVEGRFNYLAEINGDGVVEISRILPTGRNDFRAYVALLPESRASNNQVFRAAQILSAALQRATEMPEE